MNAGNGRAGDLHAALTALLDHRLALEQRHAELSRALRQLASTPLSASAAAQLEEARRIVQQLDLDLSRLADAISGLRGQLEAQGMVRIGVARQVLLVRCGAQVFAVPADQVSEIRAAGDARGMRVLPLAEPLAVQGPGEPRRLLVVDGAQPPLAFAVPEILQQDEVSVRPPEEAGVGVTGMANTARGKIKLLDLRQLVAGLNS